MKSASNIVGAFLDPKILMSRGQAMAIARAIVSCEHPANVLVFGCGRDSRMWAELASPGRCLFVEDNEIWANQVKVEHPHLEVLVISYEGRNVESSLPIVEATLAQFPVPAGIDANWDVILIDGPNGFKPGKPGRSLPIYWSSKIASASTHVFIDDFDRPLEAAYAKRFFGDRPYFVELPRIRRWGKPSSGTMLWSIGQ